MDDILCDGVCRSCLCAKYYSYRSLWKISCLDIEVLVDNPECVHLLTLVLMKSLNLYIKDRILIYVNVLCLLKVILENDLVLLLDIHDLAKDCIIIIELSKVIQLLCILLVAVTDKLCDISCKLLVAVEKPSSECDTICLVVELLRIDLVEVVQLRILEDLCVKVCNTIYTVAVVYINVCHVHSLILVDDIYALILISVANLLVQFLDDRNKLWNDLLKVSKRPLLKSLCEDSVVSVCAHLCHDLCSLVK